MPDAWASSTISPASARGCSACHTRPKMLLFPPPDSPVATSPQSAPAFAGANAWASIGSVTAGRST